MMFELKDSSWKDLCGAFLVSLIHSFSADVAEDAALAF